MKDTNHSGPVPILMPLCELLMPLCEFQKQCLKITLRKSNVVKEPESSFGHFRSRSRIDCYKYVNTDVVLKKLS